MEKYFIISNSDGDTTVDVVDKETLLERIKEEYYGDREVFTEMPSDNDTNYWGEGILVIKGKVVSPKPVQVITDFEIE